MFTQKKGIISGLTMVFVFSLFLPLNAAEAKRATSTRSSTSTFRQDSEEKDKNRRGAVRDFVMAVIGGMLRHPDPTIRKQAIQTISRGMMSSNNEDNNEEEGGIRSLFAIGGRDDDEEGTSTGVGGAVFIPDMYILLADPDPEVRDIASVGLDMIFQTDTTLLRFMNDPEPLIRKYATQIYAKKGFSRQNEDSSDNEEDTGDVEDLLALRTMLVHLKYEKEPSVRKAIIDSLEWYIRSGGNDEEGGNKDNQFTGDMFGVDVALLEKYLNDENPELRKQAIKTIAIRETSDEVLMKLMERLRIEEDEEVKKELVTALDVIRTVQYYKREGERGGGTRNVLPAGVLPGVVR